MSGWFYVVGRNKEELFTTKSYSVAENEARYWQCLIVWWSFKHESWIYRDYKTYCI